MKNGVIDFKTGRWIVADDYHPALPTKDPLWQTAIVASALIFLIGLSVAAWFKAAEFGLSIGGI